MANDKYANYTLEQLNLVYKTQESGPLKDEIARVIAKRVKAGE